MLAAGGLISILLYLLILCLVLALVWWAGRAVIGLLPPPIQQVAMVILICLIALILIGVLLGQFGGAGLGLGRPLFR